MLLTLAYIAGFVINSVISPFITVRNNFLFRHLTKTTSQNKLSDWSMDPL